MNESNGYAVFFFPQALEALGEAIKPYLQDSPAGPHVLCNEIDTGGALIEMTLRGSTPDGKQLALELMVPSGMVRMIVSTQSDELFGFGPHAFPKPAAALPPGGPTAPPAAAAPQAVPAPGDEPAVVAEPTEAKDEPQA
jgi:hypothetical protein